MHVMPLQRMKGCWAIVCLQSKNPPPPVRWHELSPVAGCSAAGSLVLSGSIDTTARLWDVCSGRCLSVKTGHTDEVLDVAFDAAGSNFVSASADGTAR